MALVLRSETLSYKDLRSRISRLAAWLAEQVPEKGARVATWAAKGELTCLMPLAAARAGLVHVPVNPLLKRAQVAHILADSGTRLLIGSLSRLQTLEDGDAAEAVLVGEGEALEQEAAFGGDLAASQADPDDLAAILYTSGSTGRPKGVMLSHANMWLGAESVASYLGLAADDVTLAVLPLSFDYGQNQLLSTWYAGGSVVPLDYLTPRDVVKSIERNGVTTLAAVPPLWVQLAELEWPPETAAKLRRLTNSGGALTEDLVRRLRAQFPQARLFAMYGLTEAFRSTFLPPEEVDRRPTSIGKAIPECEMLVVTADGRRAKPGEPGILVHRGPTVSLGYWNRPDATAEVLRPHPFRPPTEGGETVCYSGDLVTEDAEGFLYFVARNDAMIKSSGHRISPTEVEESLMATGAFQHVAVIGLPDAFAGQKVHAVGVATGEVDVAAVLQAAAEQLPAYMVPRAIELVERLPVTPNGKVDYVGLVRERSDGR